mmetsp:Transcript_16694/g.23789  ORF Transcript_16694/g.23789 Transcript_16694/m.23789 type:complete len:173 (-) Transcript_16694:1152-1670(-)
MKPVEEYLVSIFNQMAKMRQPLCISEGLALANSLVTGTKWEQEIIHFKVKRGWNPFDAEGNKKNPIGQKWYQGFWKRNCHIIERKATQKFAKDRSEWSVYRNFAQMYDEVYDAGPTWLSLSTRLAATQVKWEMAMLGDKKKLFQGVLYQKRQPLQMITTLPCWVLLLQLENL